MKVIVQQKFGNTLSKVSGATVNVTIDGITTAYTTDANGEATFTVAFGNSYTVVAAKREGWYVPQSAYSQTFVADQTVRIVTYIFRSANTGLFVVASDGDEYTLPEWEDSVEAGTRENSEAKLIKVSTNALVQAGGIFAVSIDHLRSRSYGANQAWSPSGVRFTSIPLNGNSASASYYYDGLTASRLIQQEGDERSIETPAADKCLALNFKLADGTEDELVLPGFLGSVGQWNELWLNATEVDDILISTRPSGSYLLSTLTTQKWTSTQASETHAWYWGSVASNRSKGYSDVVLPFFAY